MHVTALGAQCSVCVGQRRTQWDLTCKYWVFNFKCNVYENQSEPCILLNIYFLFLFFFLTARAVLEKGSRVISELCGGTLSNTVSAMTLPQSHPPLHPSPLTYSRFVSLVIFTYKFILFCIRKCVCFKLYGTDLVRQSLVPGQGRSSVPVDSWLWVHSRRAPHRGFAYFVLREMSGVNLCFLKLLWLKENGSF